MIGEGLSHARRLRAATACPSCATKSSCCARTGVSIVQIDDPHLCLFVDPDVRRQYDDADRAADFAVDMINQVVDGIAGIKFAVHLCRRAGAACGAKHHAGGYDPILAQLNRLKVHHLTMEFTAAGADDLESLGRLREDFEIGLGCVDVTPGAIEDPPNDRRARRARPAAHRRAAHHPQPRLRLRPRLGREGRASTRST